MKGGAQELKLYFSTPSLDLKVPNEICQYATYHSYFQGLLAGSQHVITCVYAHTITW